MSEAKYTPGPWWCNGDPVVATVSGARSIAFTDTKGGGAEDVANARLIAAAPDLLEACVEAESMLESVRSHIAEHFPNGAVMPAFTKVRAAIAKATT
jgi:hypothetical protein